MIYSTYIKLVHHSGSCQLRPYLEEWYEVHQSVINQRVSRIRQHEVRLLRSPLPGFAQHRELVARDADEPRLALCHQRAHRGQRLVQQLLQVVGELEVVRLRGEGSRSDRGSGAGAAPITHTHFFSGL